MPIETFPIGPLETNCHIVISGSDAVAVAPGGALNSGLGEVLALLKEQNLTLRAIPVSYTHLDVYKRQDKARTLGLQLSMQHRDIFEALHRVQPV